MESYYNLFADFNQGEFRFHLQSSIFRNPLFWVFAAISVGWIVCALSLIIVNVNINRLVEQKNHDEQIIEQTMHTFVNIIEAKAPSTMGHSLRVAQHSTLIAERMGFDEEECKRIFYIALMHDCGKLYIPDEILTKPSRFTDEEYEVMKKHTVSEPMRNRLPLDPHTDHTDTAEDISMSSWAYGDPAPPILKTYVGDPSKIRLIHGGVKETHVFNLHNHQWRLYPDDPKSTIIDSISIGPQECYTLDILYGAGSFNGMIGDAIFHCHLYPNFHEGMWTLWRVFDRLQDGAGTYPDGTRIELLMPLSPARDALHPGYPGFVAGTFGEEPLQPPLGIITESGRVERTPTPTEEANFVDNFAPGALYTDTCPCCTDTDVKVFAIAAVQAKLTYNKYDWHDPQRRLFVLRRKSKRRVRLTNIYAGWSGMKYAPSRWLSG